MGQVSTRVLQSCTFPWVAPLGWLHCMSSFRVSWATAVKWQEMANFLTFFVGNIFVTLISWISWAKSQQRRPGTRATRLGVKERGQGSSTGGISKGLSGTWAWAINIPLMLVRSHRQAYTPSSPGTLHPRGSFCCVLALFFPLTTYIIFPSRFCSLLCLFSHVFRGNMCIPWVFSLAHVLLMHRMSHSVSGTVINGAGSS